MTANPRKSSPRLRKWGVAAGLLALLAPLGGCSQTLVNLFGPPSVTMQESYRTLPDGVTFDHASYSRLLATFVDDDGLVDYAGLADETRTLDDYLDAVAAAPWDAMGRDEKLALLLNAYNAATLRLMLDHPDVDSIQSIPAKERWKDPRWNVGGTTYSLHQIENEAIRPHFKEPRIHWALVCAAVSCPPLRNEAYVGERLDEQLAEQENVVLTRGSRWYQAGESERQIKVTPIMQWYGGDFEQAAGSVLAYVANHDADLAARVKADDAPKVGFLGYDWSRNSQANRSLLDQADAAKSEAP